VLLKKGVVLTSLPHATDDGDDEANVVTVASSSNSPLHTKAKK
jgi:hypothetical protein